MTAQSTNFQSPVVIRLGNLAEFIAELPAPGDPVADSCIRLSLTERIEPVKTGLPFKTVELHCQAINTRGEIVWLMESAEVTWLSDGPPYARDRSLYDGMKTMHDLVRAHLEGHGYRVLPGSYGLPGDIKPVRGHFEIVKWHKNEEDGSYTITTLDPAQEAPHAA